MTVGYTVESSEMVTYQTQISNSYYYSRHQRSISGQSRQKLLLLWNLHSSERVTDPQSVRA